MFLREYIIFRKIDGPNVREKEFAQGDFILLWLVIYVGGMFSQIDWKFYINTAEQQAS